MHQELYQQGIHEAHAGHLNEAIALFNQALHHQPDFAAAYYQRGLIHFKLGKHQDAITDYTRALLSDARNASIYYARSLAYLSTGNTEGAIADAKQAMVFRPNYAAAYHLLAMARQNQGNSQKAMAGYKKAAELYLDQQDIANCRRCLEQIRQLQLAQFPSSSPSWKASPSTVSNSPLASAPPLTPSEFLHQAIEKAAQRNYAGALEDLNWAIQIDSSDVQAYISRGQVRTDLKDWHGAIADYRYAAQIFLDYADKAQAQLMLEKIQMLKTLQAQSVNATPAYPAYPANVVPFPTRRVVSTGKLSVATQNKLRRLIGADRDIVARLVQRLRQKHPGRAEDWYWEKAIYDLERDRR